MVWGTHSDVDRPEVASVSRTQCPRARVTDTF